MFSKIIGTCILIAATSLAHAQLNNYTNEQRLQISAQVESMLTSRKLTVEEVAKVGCFAGVGVFLAVYQTTMTPDAQQQALAICLKMIASPRMTQQVIAFEKEVRSTNSPTPLTDSWIAYTCGLGAMAAGVQAFGSHQARGVIADLTSLPELQVDTACVDYALKTLSRSSTGPQT